jgi:hypothetical protein
VGHEKGKMSYSVEQQRLDKATLDRTIGMLSARIIGERQEECEENVLDYIRMARMWSNKPFLNHSMQVETARMFQEIAYAPRITAWQAKAYENLLRLTRRMIGASIFRRKGKAQIACLQPDSHSQPCFCKHRLEALNDPTTA